METPVYTEQRAEPAWRLLLCAQSHPQPRALPWLWELVQVPIPGVFLKLCPKMNQVLGGHEVLQLVTQAPSGEWDPAGTGKDTRGFSPLLFVILTCEEALGKGLSWRDCHQSWCH